MTRSDRTRELGAYAGIALGVALAAYSGLAESRGWQGETPHLMSSLGICAAVVGVFMLRALPFDRVRPTLAMRGLAILAALAVGGAALALLEPRLDRLDRLVLHDRTLGSVTLALPTGDEAPNPQGAARVMITNVGGSDVGVGVLWQVGSFDDANAGAIADASAAPNGGKAEPIPDGILPVGGGTAYRSFEVRGDAGAMWITVFSCGSRLYSVIVAGSRTYELARRVLASVRCQASAADRTAEVPAVVDLPARWMRSATAPAGLSYVSGSEQLTIHSMDIIADDQLQGTMEVAARKMGNGARLGPRRDIVTADGPRAVWTGTFNEQSATVAFQVAVWRCPERDSALMLVHLGGDDERAALALFEHVRCARRDAPATAR